MAYPQDPNGNWQQPPPPPQGGYGAGGFPPPGYPQPGYGYSAVREHPDGTTVLVMGILSLVVCGLVGPFAWTKGTKALADIDANPGMYSNRGAVSAGRTCGIVGTVFLLFGIVIVVLAMVLGAFASTTSSTG